jgi:hypothetical protein
MVKMMVSVSEWIHAFILRMRVRFLKLKYGDCGCIDCAKYISRIEGKPTSMCGLDNNMVATCARMCAFFTPIKK